MSVTGLTSDDFKFHLRKLIKLELVTKNQESVYELTARGKEIANRFDYESRTIIRQPKLTTVVFVRRQHPETGTTEYLFQQRLRQPFFHYWGVIGEPVQWGELFEHAAARGLREQADIDAPLQLRGFYRQRDFAEDSDEIFEDKLFVVFVADWQGEEVGDWPYASSQWAGASWLTEQPRYFQSCADMLAMIEETQLQFATNDTTYQLTEY